MGSYTGLIICAAAILAFPFVVAAAVRYLRGGRPAGEPPRELLADNARLARENGELKQGLIQLEQRLQVLERIATDPSERTARQIDALRTE